MTFSSTHLSIVDHGKNSEYAFAIREKYGVTERSHGADADAESSHSGHGDHGSDNGSHQDQESHDGHSKDEEKEEGHEH